MDDLERKRLEEVKDLLSSACLKLFEMLKEPTQKTFVNESIEITDFKGVVWEMVNGERRVKR